MGTVNGTLVDNEARHLDQFGVLLAVTVLAIVAQMLFDLNATGDSVGPTLGAMAVNLLIGAALLLAVRAAGVRRRWTRIVDIVVGAGLALVLVLAIIELTTDQTADTVGVSSPSLVIVCLAVFSPIAVVWRLIQHRKITMATLLGAVAGYLLLANAFNFVFRALDSVSATPFFGVLESTTSYMYFSLVTITTLGYGDLFPVSDLGRLLATTEAILGQVYLVTVVAMAVGLYAQQQMKARMQYIADAGLDESRDDPDADG